MNTNGLWHDTTRLPAAHLPQTGIAGASTSCLCVQNKAYELCRYTPAGANTLPPPNPAPPAAVLNSPAAAAAPVTRPWLLPPPPSRGLPDPGWVCGPDRVNTAEVLTCMRRFWGATLRAANSCSWSSIEPSCGAESGGAREDHHRHQPGGTRQPITAAVGMPCKQGPQGVQRGCCLIVIVIVIVSQYQTTQCETLRLRCWASFGKAC